LGFAFEEGVAGFSRSFVSDLGTVEVGFVAGVPIVDTGLKLG
jgi:hypothetical protein